MELPDHLRGEIYLTFLKNTLPDLLDNSPLNMCIDYKKYPKPFPIFNYMFFGDDVSLKMINDDTVFSSNLVTIQNFWRI